MSNSWSKRWPTKPGLYWFYGCPINKAFDPNPRLLLVNVERNAAQGVRHQTMRMVLSKQTGASGKWKAIDVPTLPEVFE